MALAETLRISPAAAYMHIAAIARSNSQLADLQTVTLKDLGAAIGRSITSVTPGTRTDRPTSQQRRPPAACHGHGDAAE